MATIKSYSDLQQSRKLAEILPIESADMTFLHKEPYETSDSKFDGLHEVLCIQFIKYDKPTYRKKYRNIPYFPCWSLAALLGVLPEGVIENYYVPNLQKENGKYSIAYGNEELLCVADNPVDACYEMIIKLHEQMIYDFNNS